MKTSPIESEQHLADEIATFLRKRYTGQVEIRSGSDRLSRPMLEIRIDMQWRYSVRVEPMFGDD